MGSDESASPHADKDPELQWRREHRGGLLDQPWDISAGLATAPAAANDETLWRLVEAADADMYRRRNEPHDQPRAR
ncbi:MAG: hypothetical protein ACH36H_01705 [Candidatus Nanopelagicales bacterium]